MLMNFWSFGWWVLSSADPVTGHVDDVASASCVTSCFYSPNAPKMLLKQSESKTSTFKHTSIGEMVLFVVF